MDDSKGKKTIKLSDSQNEAILKKLKRISELNATQKELKFLLYKKLYPDKSDSGVHRKITQEYLDRPMQWKKKKD